MKKIFLVLLAAAFVFSGSYTANAGSVTTKFDDVDITIGGQMRPRFEYSDQTFDNSKSANHQFTQRSRLAVTASSAGGVKAFIQLQDVRTWGEESSTLGDYDANQFDLHQGYIDLVDLAGTPLTLRVGRQEIIIEGHRIMGNVNWTQQARSWDGVKAMGNVGPAVVNMWFTKEREGAGGPGETVATSESDATLDRNVIGGWAKIKPTDASTLSALVVYQNDDAGTTNLNRVTMGARGTLNYMGFKSRVEGYYQTGDYNDTQDVDAYMFGVRAGYTFKEVQMKPSITLWYDYLSGDSDGTGTGDYEAFDTLYATNHKFYGFMDYFLAVPSNTGGKGLQDMAVKLAAKPLPKTTVKADVHYFMLAEDATNGLADGDRELGTEMDLILKYKYAKHLMAVAGYSHFFNDNMKRARTTFGDDDADWAFVQLDYKF